jgi:hypothetical protein
MHWFLRHHPDAQAVVIGADERWCLPDPTLANLKPFPFWLYSRDLLEYGGGLLRQNVLEELPRRIGYLLARHPVRARPDGYWDYEPNYGGLGFGTNPELRDRLKLRMENYVSNMTGRFPAIDRLNAVLASVPPDVTVLVVFPPIYATALPAPGSIGVAADRACKAAFAEALAGRARSAIVDWRRERPELHNSDWFFDHTHYRRPIAELVEKDIAAALARSGPNRGG